MINWRGASIGAYKEAGEFPLRDGAGNRDYTIAVHPARQMVPQAYKDVSGDRRKGLSSFFAYGKRSAEKQAYEQAHMTPTGVPGVLNLKICDNAGNGIPFAPFNWNGRQMLTDAKGMIKYVEKDYFQTTISLENERVKYVTQMISLVAGQPTENVIALFGWEFYNCLRGSDGPDSNTAIQAQLLYDSYMTTAGIPDNVRGAKMDVFKRYSFAECSPEVMCNFGDNDPEWSRAFNKLAMLIEYHPTAILFDQGALNPLESSGVVHGDGGHNNAGEPDTAAKIAHAEYTTAQPRNAYPDSNRRPGMAFA